MPSIFSKIVRGEEPGEIIWEDRLCFAVLNKSPLRSGHSLVVPREEIDHWDDMPDELAAHLLRVSRRITHAIKRAFPCEKVALLIVGLEVRHVHVHLVPANSIAELDLSSAKAAAPEQLQADAQALRQALAEVGHGWPQDEFPAP